MDKHMKRLENGISGKSQQTEIQALPTPLLLQRIYPAARRATTG
jgi:hypothetical protein